MYRLIDDANVASQGCLLDVQESQGAAKHHSDVVEGPRNDVTNDHHDALRTTMTESCFDPTS
jgi:hypothetical protein